MSEDTEYALCGVNAVISIRKFCNILRCKNCVWCPLANYKNANTRMEHFTYENQFHIIMQDIHKFCDIVCPYEHCNNCVLKPYNMAIKAAKSKKDLFIRCRKWHMEELPRWGIPIRGVEE